MPGYYEGAPTSILEAMAAGLPVISTKSGGIPELIVNGKNGIITEEKDSKMLADAIVDLMNNRNLVESIREKNLESIKQKDWPIIAKKITDVYNLTI